MYSASFLLDIDDVKALEVIKRRHGLTNSGAVRYAVRHAPRRRNGKRFTALAKKLSAQSATRVRLAMPTMVQSRLDENDVATLSAVVADWRMGTIQAAVRFALRSVARIEKAKVLEGVR